MVGGNSHLNIKIAKNQAKFSPSGKLLVVPTLIVAVYAQSWKPLRNGKNVIAVFREILVATAATDFLALRDFIIPFYIEYIFLLASQWLWQVNTHHRLIDYIMKWIALGICHRQYIGAVSGKFCFYIQPINLPRCDR